METGQNEIISTDSHDSPEPQLANGEQHSVEVCSGGETRLYVTWEDVTVTVQDDTNGGTKDILFKSTGYAEPGKVLAILGPSGGGKTTLLNSLAGRLQRLQPDAQREGTILINNRSRDTLPFGVSAYVTQEDILLKTLTIREAVYYSAELQLPDNMPRNDKREKADRIIAKMGLQENADTTIMDISGGQKRRLSICLEILADPQLIFMDEPTSGLDSAASMHVMSSITRLAHDRNLSRTVVVSVHQPSKQVFELFDELCLLAYGKTVYFGPISGIREHYMNCGFDRPPQANPADYYLGKINKDFQTEHANQDGSSRSRLQRLWDFIRCCLCFRDRENVSQPIVENGNQDARNPTQETCNSDLSDLISHINALFESFDEEQKEVGKRVDRICLENKKGDDGPSSNFIKEDIDQLLSSHSLDLRQKIVNQVSTIFREEEEEAIDINVAIELLVASYNESLRNVTVSRIAEIRQNDGEPQRRSQAAFWNQCCVLTRRSSVNMCRDWGYYWLRFFIYLAIAFCDGTVFYKLDISYPTINDRGSVLNFLGGYLTFMTIGGFPSFVEDVKIFERERLSGHYGVLAYVISHTISSAPFLIFVSVIPGIITYFMVGLQRTFLHFFYFALVLYVLMTIVESLMMMIASIIPNFLYGIITGAGVQGIMMLTSGFFRLPHDIPKPVWKYPVHYMGFHKYGGQGFFKNEFLGMVFPNREGSYPQTLTGLQIVSGLYQMEVGYTKWVDLAVLVSMVVVYRFLFFAVHKLNEKFFPWMKAKFRRVWTTIIRRFSFAANINSLCCV